MAVSKKSDGSGEKKTSVKEEGSSVSSTPEWLNSLKQLLDRIDPKDARRAVQKIEEFVEGDITWAEVQGMPPQLLCDIAERGYLKLTSGRLKEAEAIFKGLSMIDHKTAYYYTALGAIHQKQENWLDALAEYTVAIELDPKDTTAYVNRGEVYYALGLEEEPLRDFEAAIQLDPEGKDPWANRARFLKKRAIEEIAKMAE